MSAELIDVTRHGADRVVGLLRQRHGLVVDQTVLDRPDAHRVAEASVLATSAGELYSDLIFFEGRCRMSAVSSGRLVVSCIIGGEAEAVGFGPLPTLLSTGDVIAWPIGHDVEIHARDMEQHTISLPMRSLRVAGYRGDRVNPRLLARPTGPILTDLWWRHAQFVDQELNREGFFADPRVVGALEQLLAAVALRVFAAVEPTGPSWGRSG